MKFLVLLFIRIHFFIRTKFGINLHGLGKVQYLLKKDFVFNAFNKRFYYYPGIEGSYDYLLIGKSNEPETHRFFRRILPQLKESNFIDVGASVGEFVFGVSNYQNIEKIFAFEPRPDCAMVLRNELELNIETRVTIFENAVSDTEDRITLHLNAGGTSSGIYSLKDNLKQNTVEVTTVLLDVTLPEIMKNPIMLIDVEGAEPLVLRGGKSFIKKNNPLIIFEYNHTSKNYFHLNDIQEILGNGYSIFRLKNDGSLDQDFSNSWNCVAIPANSAFEEILIN